MAEKLNEITTQYHTFTDNQVLTKDRLNEVISYFDGQDRLSRVLLSGTGIACGFALRLRRTPRQTVITVTQGAGVTTDGDLLTLYRMNDDTGSGSVDIGSVELRYYRPFEDSYAGYPFFRINETIGGRRRRRHMKLIELLHEKDEGTRPLASLEGLDDMVLLLYLESYAKERELCTSIDCDNQGTEQVRKLRFLLISAEDAQYIINRHDTVFRFHDVAKRFTLLPGIKLPKVDLSGVTDYAGFKKRFLNVFSPDLIRKLQKGYLDLKDMLSGDHLADINEMRGRFFGGGPMLNENLSLSLEDEPFRGLFDFSMTQFGTIHAYQHRYGLLSDLIKTYNEARELVLHFNSECCPDIGAFPKHLMLGRVAETGRIKTYRHRFYKSPIFEPENYGRKKLYALLQRFEKLVRNFDAEFTGGKVRITPSKLNGELGDMSIPAYYKVDGELLALWDFDKTRDYREKYNLSYHTDALADVPEVRQPLLFASEGPVLYRIEGHVGNEVTGTREQILEMRKKFGLDFECMAFDFEDEGRSFADLWNENPSVAYRGGVPEGGTFILVSVNGETVAELSAGYRITEEKKEQKCIYLTECTYPWISSLKYLNNLSRSLKGTQSHHRMMPQEYRLQVVSYKINGYDLIRRPATVSVPLQEIYRRRVHAITEALNKRFDKGLVFDFNESQKRFVIISAKDDSFSVRFRDVTFRADSPVYTFSDKGMFRNDRIFRPDAMRCRNLKGYDPEFYAGLQHEMAPVGKDDDYGAFKDKWYKWNMLKSRLLTNEVIAEMGLNRKIKSEAQLPAEIRSELEKLKGEFNAVAGKELNFMLDGDWVNGDWVNKSMLKHYSKNRNNTHDDIVNFIDLRKLLHSETGVTKLSLYVTNMEYSSVFDNVIQKYDKFADIYFGMPKGENAITV